MSSTVLPRPTGSASPPFFTRRSTLAWSAVCLLSSFGFSAMTGSGSVGTGSIDVVIAVVGATALVTFAVAWIAGVVIALRAESLLWLLIAILPLVPFNAALCALFAPAGKPEKPR